MKAADKNLWTRPCANSVETVLSIGVVVVCLLIGIDYLFCCSAGWTGEYCETNIDECLLSVNNSVPVCHHSGICIDTRGSYRCDCNDTGYTGMSSCLSPYCLL